LCDDIGKKLGVGAHLSELERTKIGTFRIEESLSIEELKNLNMNEPDSKGVYGMDEALSWMPELKINEEMIKAVTHGNPIKTTEDLVFSADMKTAPGIRIKSPDGSLLAIGSYSAEKNTVNMNVVLG
jgi:tRNA pseudouridine55 synthase